MYIFFDKNVFVYFIYICLYEVFKIMGELYK